MPWDRIRLSMAATASLVLARSWRTRVIVAVFAVAVTVFLQAVVERLQADAEQLGRTLLHAAALLQRGQDDLLVGTGQ